MQALVKPHGHIGFGCDNVAPGFPLLDSRFLLSDRLVALQGVGRYAQQLPRCIAGPQRQGLVRDERPQQVPRPQPRETLLDRGEEPCLLRQLNDFRRQRGRAGIAGLHLVERAVQINDQPGLVDFVMTQDRGDVAVGRVSEPQQPMLDLDIVMGAGQGQPGRCFERPPARLVETAYQRFQIDRRHPLLLIVS